MAFVSTAVVPRNAGNIARNRCLTPRRTRPPQRFISRCCVPATSSEITSMATQLRSEITRLVGDECGLFTASSSIRQELGEHITALESSSKSFDRVTAAMGTWRLLYTTITILGGRRARLAVATKTKPGFVRIADITQLVGDDGTSVNTVNFKLITGGTGKFEVRARYEIESESRVNVMLDEWSLVPDKLRKVLGENINLLLETFNPEGWLDITYVDDNLRIGRDHNANIFVLERVE